MRRLKINIYKENLLIIFTSLPIDKTCCLGLIERKTETDSLQYTHSCNITHTFNITHSLYQLYFLSFLYIFSVILKDAILIYFRHLKFLLNCLMSVQIISNLFVYKIFIYVCFLNIIYVCL